MKQNIAILCLVKQFGKDTAQKLSNRLDMFYADVNDLMEYNFINDATIKASGQQYFDKLEGDLLKKISEYVNSIFTLGFSTINKHNNIDFIKKGCLLIFLNLKYEDFVKLNKKGNKNLEKLDSLVYEDRKKIMNQYADIVVNIKNTDKEIVLKEVVKSIKNYYKY